MNSFNKYLISFGISNFQSRRSGFLNVSVFFTRAILKKRTELSEDLD